MADFEEIDTLRDDSGLAVVITRKRLPSGDARVTFRFVKEFRRREGAPMEQTSFLGERHLDALTGMVERIRKRIALEC